jgi:hypothetical protein
MSKIKDLALPVAKIKSASVEGERLLRVIATAPTVDRDLEVIDSNSIQVPVKPSGLKYLADMTKDDKPDIPFLIDHEWAIEKQAGSVQSIFINEAGETEAVVKLSTVDNGERVYTLAKEGHLGNAFSIGYSLQNATLENGEIKHIEMLEFSAVFKGSNRNARLLEVKSVKEIPMTEIEQKKAEAEKLLKEVAELEAAETVEDVVETPEAVVEEPKEEVAETPVVEEAEAEEEEAVEEVVEAEVVEEETKSVKETKSMSNKDIAAENVVEKSATPVQEAVVVKTISKNEARKMIVNAFGATFAKDEKAFAQIEEEAKGVKVINGTTGDPLFVPEILASDIRERYLIAGNVGSLVNKIDIEGAETFRQLVETAGTGFMPVALGAVKPEDQPVWTSVVFEPFEWALIVAWLDGVQKRSPLAVYNQIVNYIAREYRKLEDKIILTNPARTVGSESRAATGLIPILSTSGRNDNVQSYAAADVLPALAKAWGAIESDETITLVCNRETWARLAVTLDGESRPLFTVVGSQVTVGALGSFNVVLSQQAGGGEVVIGAFSDYNLVTRGGLSTLFSREATVGSLNLFTQDASALRADVDITGGPVMIQSFYLLDFGVASSS